MASCPVCNSDIPDDFGLIECPSCSAQLLVHMDGRVEYSDGSDAPAPLSEVTENPGIVEMPPAEESGGGFEFGGSDVELPSEPASEEPFESSPVDHEEPEAEIYRPPVTASTNDSPDLSDVADFGNSDASGRDGSLRYDLIITGIDTADVREAFREAITDRKLVWDIDQILRSLKNGEVKIENVTPPKAYIVISRLRSLPVQVRWEQYAVSQT
jgi:hypothetical protein